MKKQYFIVGLRPVFYEEKGEESFVSVFNWETGLFSDDFSYYKKLFSGPHADETEEVTEEKFNQYVQKLKKEKGLQ